MFNNIDAEYRCSKLSINISKILMLKMRTFSNIDAEDSGNGNIVEDSNIDAENDSYGNIDA